MDKRDETKSFVPLINTTFLLGKCQAGGDCGFLPKIIPKMLFPRSTNSGVITMPRSELIQISAM